MLSSQNMNSKLNMWNENLSNNIQYSNFNSKIKSKIRMNKPKIMTNSKLNLGKVNIINI